VKIFVVEDEPVELKLAVQVLTAAGHDVDRARAAEEALTAIRDDRPDVILLDISLPGMDGLALARELKSHPLTCHIPIVAVTSYPEEFPKSEAMAAGCDAYVPKPLSTRLLPQMLVALVANAELDSTDETPERPDR
jgi:CheY-like chemotaxis protein